MHRRQSSRRRSPLLWWIFGLLVVLLASYGLPYHSFGAQSPSLEWQAQVQSKAVQINESMGEKEFFIRIHDGEFVEGCRPFRVSGWNQWEVRVLQSSRTT